MIEPVENSTVREQAEKVCAALDTMQFGNCRFLHHHVWNRNGVELLPCAREKRENSFDCAHASDLNLQAGVTLAGRFNIIPAADLDSWVKLIKRLNERILEADDTAFMLQGVHDHIRLNSYGQFPYDEAMLHHEGFQYKIGDIRWHEIEERLGRDQREAALPRFSMREVLSAAIRAVAAEPNSEFVLSSAQQVCADFLRSQWNIIKQKELEATV